MTAEWGSSQCVHVLNVCEPEAQTLRTALKRGHVIPALRGKACFPVFVCSSWHIWGTTVK